MKLVGTMLPSGFGFLSIDFVHQTFQSKINFFGTASAFVVFKPYCDEILPSTIIVTLWNRDWLCKTNEFVILLPSYFFLSVNHLF
jgi:hypothetical protein